MQKETSRDTLAKGPVWISRAIFPAPPESDLRDSLYFICDQLKNPHQTITPKYEVPLLDVRLEFVGSRSGVPANATEPDMSELEKLERLEKECESDLTILYIHGGALYSSSPAAYRAATARLARTTKSRVASIGYRLTPQNTFPGPVLDALVAYASLLYPPPGAAHSAVPADRIILAGNSTGATLCFAVTKLLLELAKHPSKQHFLFHGRRVSLPLPADLAVARDWADPCDVMPSWLDPNAIDILGVLQPALLPGYSTDSIWPSKPPRDHLYCSAAMLDHKLACPAAVKDWMGAPPMWFACGCLERGVDGNRAVASQAARCGVSVQWNEYEGMIHEFMVILGSFPQTKHCFASWSMACKEFVGGKKKKSQALKFKIPDYKEVVDLGDVKEISPLSFEEVRK
ncbi:hypothetical protein G7Y89_g6505 [Cudoniella acicularis]|uniref:Alpha/beta hydrolase fold-3 domain-containing protein n=1 Tax=Cudoniella acicularis TaxID=354080 RepID=A0A8H4W2D1_9HELO|nr:hypothetical protein G7Y89_g6505 [Cudoniella acicularis]